MLVQIGDVLDRGDEELELLELLRALKQEARAKGGRVITLLGNHEILNAAGVEIYASPRSAAKFVDGDGRSFRPGTPLAAELATWPIACVVGDTAFIHAGLTVQAAREIDTTNAAAAQWISRGDDAGPPPQMLWPTSALSPRSPLWMRDLSSPPDVEPSASACGELEQALAVLGAKRLIVGHTVQSTINGACGALSGARGGGPAVWRVDVGMSAAMGGGTPQALELLGDGRVREITV